MPKKEIKFKKIFIIPSHRSATVDCFFETQTFKVFFWLLSFVPSHFTYNKML